MQKLGKLGKVNGKLKFYHIILLSILLAFAAIFSPFSGNNPTSWLTGNAQLRAYANSALQELEELKRQNEARQKQINSQIGSVSAQIRFIALRIDSIQYYEIPKAQIELKMLQNREETLKQNAIRLQEKQRAAEQDRDIITKQSDEMVEKLNNSQNIVKSLARQEVRGDGALDIANFFINGSSSEETVQSLEDHDQLSRTSTRLSNRFNSMSHALKTKQARIDAINERIKQLQIENEQNIHNTQLTQEQTRAKIASINALAASLPSLQDQLEASLGDLQGKRNQTAAEHAMIEQQMNDAVRDAIESGGGLPPGTSSAFDAGYIIADSKFYTAGTMSVADIQNFLNRMGANCHTNCLKDYHVTTDPGAASSGCSGYPGGQYLSAAQAISAVSITCRISEKVLLVMLQKEQGLLTKDNPTDNAYRYALGFGCPDTAGCNASYGGLYSQLYNAAWQFNYYRDHAGLYRYKANMTNNIQYHPNVGCGYQSVFIRNNATAGLYIYTPYVPNQAALNAGMGTGDSCSSYGNRNFYNLYYSWFGSPK